MISEPQVFVCPSAPYPTTDSYSEYYVPREPTTATGFLLGCPNHAVENSTFGAFGAGLTLKGKTEPVLWNNQPVAAGSQVTGGTLTFADGTTVSINSGVNVVVLVSFDEGQGRIYSAVKLPIGSLGTIEVKAAHGTHFDVATPACTAGVRGTQFTVTTSKPSGQYQTDVAVTEGTVWVDTVWPGPSTMALPAGSSHTFFMTQPATQPNPGPIVVTGPTIGYGYVTWTLTNVSQQAFTINRISMTGPGNNTWNMITLNGSLIYASASPLPVNTTISSGWLGTPSQLTIGAGQEEALTVQVAPPTEGLSYSLSVQ